MSSYASQPTAPGTPGSSPPPTTATTGVAEAPPGGSAPPMGNGMMSILVMAPAIVLLFFTMRGQSKKQKEVEANLKLGDVVVTQSGLIGKLTEFVGDARVKIEIAPGVNVRMLKSAVSGVDGGDTKPADGKDAKDKAEEKRA